MKKIKLIIEQGKDGKLWGRIEHGDNLLTDYASSMAVLKRKMKKLCLFLFCHLALLSFKFNNNE